MFILANLTTNATKTSLATHSEANVELKIEGMIDQITKGATQYFKSIVTKMANANLQNTQTLCEFISVETSEHHLKLSSKLTKIKILYLFNRYLDYKQFQLVTKDDIKRYLDSLKKPEAQDPTHKWMGTYNTRQMVISKFFRWLYNYHNEPDSNKWITPPCVQGIRPSI